jgi:hypothetical protein
MAQMIADEPNKKFRVALPRKSTPNPNEQKSMMELIFGRPR